MVQVQKGLEDQSYIDLDHRPVWETREALVYFEVLF